MGVPIVKEHTVPVLIVTALPADQGVCLFPLCRCHAVKGTVLPALYGRQSFIWVLSHVFPPFFLSRSPRKGFLPHSCGVFQRWHAPRTSGHFVPKSGVGRGTGAFIYALSADETSPALAAPRHAITALFSCCFKCPCPTRRQPHFRSNADRAYNTLHFASKVVCQGASPFGNP